VEGLPNRTENRVACLFPGIWYYADTRRGNSPSPFSHPRFSIRRFFEIKPFPLDSIISKVTLPFFFSATPAKIVDVDLFYSIFFSRMRKWKWGKNSSPSSKWI